MALRERERLEADCPYCRDRLSDPVHECVGCGAGFHADCWGELGGCSTLGCTERSPSRPGSDGGTVAGPREKARAEEETERRPVIVQEGWKDVVMRTGVGLLMGAFALGLWVPAGTALWDMLHGQFGATAEFPSGRVLALIGCTLLALPLTYMAFVGITGRHRR